MSDPAPESDIGQDGLDESLERGVDRTLVFAITLAVLLIIGSAIFSAYNVFRLRRDTELVEHTYNVVAVLESIMEKVVDAEAGQRGYLITGDAAYYVPYRDAPAMVEDLVQQVEQLTIDNPPQQGYLPQLRERIAVRLDRLAENAKIREEQGFDAVQAVVDTDQGRRDMEALRKVLDDMQNSEKSLLIKRSARSAQMYYTTLLSVLLGTVLGLLAIAAFVWLLWRHWSDRNDAAAELWDERERYHATLSSIGDAVIATDELARIVFVNPVAAALTGWDPEEAKGRPLEDVLPIINETTREPAINPVDKVLAEGVIVGLANHTLLIRKDGVEIPIDDSAAPIRNRDKKVTGCVLVFRDMIERRRSEAEINRLLRQEKRRAEQLRKLADAALTLNSATGRESVVDVVKSEAKLVFDAERADVHIGELPPDEEERVESLIELPTDGLVVPMVARSGEPFGYLHLEGRDDEFTNDDRAILSHLAHMAAVAIQNAELYEELRIANHRKTEFLATLAHELRNPLAPIRYSLELMQLSETDPEVQKESRTIIARQVEQMVRLIDDLLDVSRISRGKFDLRPERVALQSVIETAREASDPIIAEFGHQFTAQVPAEPIWIEADPTRLAQVLLNLLNNAAKYTPAGGRIELAVDPPSDATDGRVAIRIRDNGVGIPANMLNQVFEMFTQVDRSLERSHGGLGIGLTLVRRLVEMHGGTVEAHSEGTDAGSEFVVLLPCTADTESEVPRTKPSSEDNGKVTRPLRVLAVDDNQDAVDSLARMLKLKGHEVRTAYDGLAAVDAAADFRPDVALLDIGLPRLSGYDAARRIRQLPGGDAMTLVAITGWGQEEDRRHSEQAGFNFHLVKPVDPNDLLDLLDKMPPGGSTPAEQHAP